nr:unnamed protein product [Callosobruchus analis]
MLKTPSDSAQRMTVQNLEPLEAMEKQTANKNGHISFSVASLLADTRPVRPPTPSSSSPVPNQSSDEDYDSNQEDSIVDVEDLNSEEKSEDVPTKDNEFPPQKEAYPKDSMLSQAPIRPTPFSALAAAVYQAAHPNWPHQGLVNPFGGPTTMFQGSSPFGIPSLNSGRCSK